jgi:HemY protein
MTKYIISFLLFVALLAGALLYIGDDAMLTLASTGAKWPIAFPDIEMSWQAVIVLGTLFMVGVITAWSVLLWLYRLPRRLKSGVGMRRRNRAIDAMEEALIAGAEGDMDRARKASARGRDLAGSTDLGHIISATAAEACGDRDEAVAHYTAMLDSPKTRPTGQRGLAQAKLATGDIPGAVEAARIAFDENVQARWAFDTLFKALAADFRWTEAREVLEKGKAAKHVPSDVFARRRAVLLSAEADYWMDHGQHDKALKFSKAALKDAPDFAPAAAIAAYELAGSGAQKKAANLLESAWKRAPHPALSLAYFELYPGESIACVPLPASWASRGRAVADCGTGGRGKGDDAAVPAGGGSRTRAGQPHGRADVDGTRNDRTA